MTRMEKMTWRTWMLGLALMAGIFLLAVAQGPGWFAVAYGGP